MEIKQEREGRRGAFYIEKDGKRVAEMTFAIAGSRMIVDHTEVGEELRGTGAGKRLVRAGVEYARENDLKLRPLCSFAEAIINKTPELQDVLWAPQPV